MYVHEHAKAYISRWRSTHQTPCLIFVMVCGQQHFQHSNDNSSILLDRMYLEGILHHQWGKFSLCCLINIATLSCQLKMTCLPNILEVASFGDRGAMHWCPITKCQNLFLMPHLAKNKWPPTLWVRISDCCDNLRHTTFPICSMDLCKDNDGLTALLMLGSSMSLIFVRMISPVWPRIFYSYEEQWPVANIWNLDVGHSSWCHSNVPFLHILAHIFQSFFS